MTFAELAARARVNVKGVMNKVEILREAENDFIEKTLCTETFTEINTADIGSLTNLYDLPSDFVKEIRVEYDGLKLEPLHQATDVRIYDTNNNLLTGTPNWYWIEDQDIHLVPKPSSHSKIGLWYVNYNTDTSSASPIIPTIEHRKLIEYLNAMLLERSEQFRKAQIYWDKYNAFVIAAVDKYFQERFKQSRIVDVVEDTWYPKRTIGAVVVDTSPTGEATLDTYVWKYVQLSDVLTEQTFVTGSGQLTLANLDSDQTALPSFEDPVEVQITGSYQDRGCFKSTAESVSGGNVTFGLTLSEIEGYAGGNCFFDIRVIQL